MKNHKNPKPIAIFGAGGFGIEVAMLIDQINHVKEKWRLIGFFDDGKEPGSIVNDWSVLGGIKELNSWSESLALVFALGDPGTKLTLLNKLNNNKIWHPILIHPSVIMGLEKYIEIGEGTIICAGTIITSNIRIGKHVVLNLACTVGHETTIGDFSAFMPMCNISGEVLIGKCSFWGTGAKVINRCKIDDETTIGAGAVVIGDLPSNITAVGVPAKIVKTRM
jgi:sugar O-acyltransferase (sialic acid O-acetyltransferase NeuD family)